MKIKKSFINHPRNLIIAIVILFSPILGQQNVQAKQYIFTGYDVFCGLPVFTGQNPQIATAEKDAQGSPIIHIDPTALNNLTSSRIFTLAHECAHHLLGHTSQLGQSERYYGGTRKQELEADCWAAHKLSQYGQFSDLQFQTLKNLADGHFRSNGYPSGVERAQNIYTCASVGNLNSNSTQRCSTRLVPKTIMVNTYQPRTVPTPCSHFVFGPFGPTPLHQFDVVVQQVPVQVPSTQMVEETYCN